MVRSPVPGPGNAAARISPPTSTRVANWRRDKRFVPRLVDAAVVVVGAPARIDVELLPDAVHLPLYIAVLDLGDRMEARALQEQVADDQPPDVRRVRSTARL